MGLVLSAMSGTGNHNRVSLTGSFYTMGTNGGKGIAPDPTNMRFFVSGSRGAAITSIAANKIGLAAFGGDVNISGSLKLGERNSEDGGMETYLGVQQLVGQAAGGNKPSHSGMHADDVRLFAASGTLYAMTSNGKIGAIRSGTSGAVDGSGTANKITYWEDGNTVTSNAGFTVDVSSKTKLTIGDGTAEDTSIVFDGNATDVRIGIDDGTDKLEIGTGAAMGTTTALTIDTSQQVAVVATTAASSTTTGALTVAGGASVAADLYVGDDLRLASDDAVLALGVGNDVTLTHDGGTGATLASAGAFVVDGAAAVTVDSDAALTLGGASIDMDADGGAVNIDGSGGINIGIATDTAIDIDSSTLDIDASGAVTIDSTSTIVISGDGGATLSDDTEALAYDGSGNVDFDAVALDIDASGAITVDGTSTIGIGTAANAGNISIGTNATARTLTLGNNTGASATAIVAGTGNASVNSTGHFAVTSSLNHGHAIQMLASAGGMHFRAAGAAGEDITIANTAGSVVVQSGEAIANAVVLAASAGGAMVTVADNFTGSIGNGTDLFVSTRASANAAYEKIVLQNTVGTGNDAILLNASAGGVTAMCPDGKQISLMNSGQNTGIFVKPNSSASSEKIQIASVGTGTDSIDIDSSGGVDMDIGTGGLLVDTTGAVSLDAAAASNFTVATGGADADDLTIAVTGGGDSSLLLSSAGTGADAVSIDVSAGSMVVAPSLADGQTLKVGKNGAVEMVFTPHGTAGNEKWSLTNTAGTAADAIAIDASAGGVSIDGAAASNFTTSAGALTLKGAGGETIGTNGQTAAFLGDMTIAGDLTVNGTTTQVDTTNLQVKDKNILINDGGGATSGAGAGLDIEEGGSVTGYIRVADDDRGNLDLKACNGSELKLDVNAGVTWTIGGALTVEGTSVLNQDLTTDASPTFAGSTNGNIQVGVTGDNEIDTSSGNLTLDSAGGTVAVTDMLTVSGQTMLASTLDVVGATNITGTLSVSTGILPDANDGAYLGSTSKSFSDLFLADAGVINWNNGNSTLTGGSALLNSSVAFRATKLEIDGANDYLDVDTNLKVVAAADIILDPGGANVLPGSDNADALGAAGTAWSDLFLGDGAVINFDSGDMTITNASNELQVDGGDLVMEGTNKVGLGGAPSTDYIQKDTDVKIVAAADIVLSAAGANVKPGSNDECALGVSGTAFSDLFLASGGVINFHAGDVTVTHAANVLTFAGATSGYVFTNGDVLPGADNSLSLGSSTARWANIYTGDLHLANDRGNWTLVEENNMLTFRNNLNGKWYRMVMEEIDPDGRDSGMQGPAPQLAEDTPDWEI